MLRSTCYRTPTATAAIEFLPFNIRRPIFVNEHDDLFLKVWSKDICSGFWECGLVRNKMFDSPSAEDRARQSTNVLIWHKSSQGQHIRVYVNIEVLKNVLLPTSNIRTWYGVRAGGTK